MVPGQLLPADALLLGGDNITGQDRQDRAVHGHRHRHLVERNTAEQHLHVEDQVHRHTGHADVADNPGMVGIIAAMGRQIESDRQSLLARRQIAPVEGVRGLRRREPGILANRPGLVHIHGRIGAALEGRESRHGVELIESVEIRSRIQGFHADFLGRLPEHFGRLQSRRRLRLGFPVLIGSVALRLCEADVGKIRYHFSTTPKRTSCAVSLLKTSPPMKM